MSTLKPEDIQAGRFYRAKKPRRCVDGGFNDRKVLWISRDRTRVQYDSYTVADGRHYPTVEMEKFWAWVGKEITKEQYKDTTVLGGGEKETKTK